MQPTWTVALVLALAAAAFGVDAPTARALSVAQDPTRPAPPPQGQAPLRPVEEPYVEPVIRSDLPERYGVRDPIEGVWKVRSRAVSGQPVAVGSGFMSVGRRHVVVCFQAPGPDERVPLLRSAVYEWSRVDNSGMVRLLVDIGHYNDSEGDVTIETRGKLELRRFELLADALRVHQDDGSWIEFVRAE